MKRTDWLTEFRALKRGAWLERHGIPGGATPVGYFMEMPRWWLFMPLDKNLPVTRRWRDRAPN